MRSHVDEQLPEILRGCRKFKLASQHELYKLYYPYAMSVAIRYMNEEPEAISVVNDAFLKVFKSIKSFDLTQPFKPWFRRVIVNTALTQLKRQQKYHQETAMENQRDVAAREEILSQIGYKELIGLVQSLSASYRAVFNMYVIDGFKHEEIAEKLNISVGTSKSNLVRARRKLQELVAQQLTVSHA